VQIADKGIIAAVQLLATQGCNGAVVIYFILNGTELNSGREEMLVQFSSDEMSNMIAVNAAYRL